MSRETDSIGQLTSHGLEFWISMTIQQKWTSVRPLPPSSYRVAPTEFPSHRTELQTFVADTLQASKRSESRREISTIAPYAGPSKIQPGFEAYGRRHGIR